MKNELVEKVKKSKFLYATYYYFMSLLINAIKPFVRTDDKLILFVSYGGRYFNDSPKDIYEYMKHDDRFREYKLVWAFRNPKEFTNVESVKIDSIKYYINALKARCWITNNMVERALHFSGKNTYYFHTTHGTLPKLMGYDSDKLGNFGSKSRYIYDCSCAQSELEKKLQLSMFGLMPDQVLVCGYPKNDRLARATVFERNEILNKLGIDKEKKVILYAPTYREDSSDEMISPVDFKKWEKALGKQFVVLFRAHPVVANKTKIDSKSGFIYDVSSYSDNVDLMIASDMLVSDYSGIFFEYAVLGRPMFCYAYDYEEYTQLRPLYFDIREELPSGTEDELLEKLKNPSDEDMLLIHKFKNKYVSEYGHATELAVNNIFGNIQ